MYYVWTCLFAVISLCSQSLSKIEKMKITKSSESSITVYCVDWSDDKTEYLKFEMDFHLHVKQIFNILDFRSLCKQYGYEAFAFAAKSLNL